MNVSLICACKNRIDALRVSLSSWLAFDEIKEIIIVDWSSDEPIDFLLNYDKRIKIIRVSGKDYFNQPQPLNLALSMATGDYILKVDCDYVINPYYNFFTSYPIDDNTFVSGRFRRTITEDKFKKERHVMSFEDMVNYLNSYSPFFKFLFGMLFIKRENLLKVGGYNETLGQYYAYEDDEIVERLKLLNLNEVRIDYDNTLIHIPHPDKKRTEYFYADGKNEHVSQHIRNNLSGQYEGQELEWQVEYALAIWHVEENKKIIGDITESYVKPKTSWSIEEVYDRYYSAEIMEGNQEKNQVKLLNRVVKNKLDNFPSVYYISLEESVDRRQNLHGQFNQYQINDLNPIISKRFSECDDVVIGPKLYILDDGTKGCVVSHLKMIKKWYEETEEDYAFFCEDDLSLETVKYWDFTWEDFIENLPEDAECVQLCCIRETQEDIKLRERSMYDWSVTAYIMTRDYARKIIERYCVNDTYELDIKGTEFYPMPETVLFYGIGKVYCINLFVEEQNLISTFTETANIEGGNKEHHRETYDYVLNWWKTNALKYQEKPKEKVKKIEKVKSDEIVLDIEELLTKYSLDTENALNNFYVGLWYEVNGHNAPALSYFLRCSERTDDDNLAYEALIHASNCYDRQGTRDLTAKGILQQALCLLPKRPEAYYLLSKFSEKRDQWQDCYIYANTALKFADFDLEPLNTDVEYVGKYGLLFQKAMSGWWWGKLKESRDILLDLKYNYEMSDEHRKIVNSNLERYKLDAGYYKPLDEKYIEILSEKSPFEDLERTFKIDVGKIDLLLTGQYDEDTDRILKAYSKLDFVNKIIVSTWEDEKDKFKLNLDNVEYIWNEKPTTPGTDNRNMQIVSCQNGLKKITTKYSAKMRTDQKYTDESMLKMYEYFTDNLNENGTIFAAGLYPSLLFHPRDHIFWGLTDDLKQLYDIPLEYNGFSDKLNVPKSELWKYYKYFVRTETYIGVRYCMKYDDSIIKFILDPENYLHDGSSGWNEAHAVSQKVLTKAFKSFPREGIDLEWKRKELSSYPYDDQKNGYGECWAEDF